MERTLDELQSTSNDVRPPAHNQTESPAEVSTRRLLNVRAEPALTFDDVLLVPRYSEIRSRGDVSTNTRLTRRIRLDIPIVSANMDTVTESTMAISMARAGGIGVIHRFLTPERQANEVRRVKRAEALVVRQPMTMPVAATVRLARYLMGREGVGGLIVVDEQEHVVGIVSRRDIMFVDDDDKPVAEVMTPRERLVTAAPDTTIDDARAILDEHRIEKLPLVDEANHLVGLITAKDIEHRMNYPHASKDVHGHLRVAAAVGVRPGYIERAALLLEAGADALVIDIAHGDSVLAIEAARGLREAHGEGWDLIVGNVATGDGVKRLAEAGADAVKVGIGPGSICITRIVTGFGVPQLSAVAECAAAAAASDLPLIADGGIKNSGDIVKALAAGASTVMVGSLLAGTRESPGMVVVRGGRRFKLTRGMASLGATMSRNTMENGPSHDRDASLPKREYERVVPEGVEAKVPYRGPVDDLLHQLVGGLRSGLSYAGARNLAELPERAEFMQITAAGVRESGPHDVDLQ
jgi:IMP dehydrogenase